MIYTIWKEVTFDAAHRLPALPVEHPCSRIHGHTYTARVEVTGIPRDDLAWVMDLGVLKATMNQFIDQLDHHYLNDIDGLENPTAECLAHWLGERLMLAMPPSVRVTMVEIRETPTSGARWFP